MQNKDIGSELCTDIFIHKPLYSAQEHNKILWALQKLKQLIQKM